MSRILRVEDEASLARALVLGLCEAGFVVDHERDGESGLLRASQQDYALLLGSLGLLLILATIMYLTRNIDWYELGKEDDA